MGDAESAGRSFDHTRGRRSRSMPPKQWMIVRTLVESRLKSLTSAPLDHRGHPREELKYLDDYKEILAEIDR